MKYVNNTTHVEIELGELTEEEEKFYEMALEKFQKNANWHEFDAFILSQKSPFFGEISLRMRQEGTKHPLFRAVSDMSSRLGVQQGLIKRNQPLDLS